MSYTPKPRKLQEGGPLQTFLEPSREVFDATKYSPEEAARIQRHLDNKYTLYDAQNNATERQALHTMLLKDDPDGPTNSELITVDVETAAADLAKSEKYSGEDKERWTRTLSVIDNIQKKGISIVKDEDDRYWLEDSSTGVRKYSANAIAEVRELLLAFGAVTEKPSEDESGQSLDDGTNTSGGENDLEDKLISDLVPDEYKGGFNKSERFALAAITTDFTSSIGALLVKMTGIGAPVGAGVSAIGGIGATLMDMYSDYLNEDVTPWEMAGNAAVRIGLEAVEAFTFLPVSLVKRLQKGSKAGKLLRKAIQYGVAGQGLNTALSMEWNELLDKISEGGIKDLEIDDWRRLGALAQYSMSFTSSLHTRGQLKKQLRTANTKANTGVLSVPKTAGVNKAGVDVPVGKVTKNTTAQRANIREIKKEITPPKKITPKREALVERAVKPTKDAAEISTIKANKQALSNNKQINLEKNAAIDKIDKRLGAKKRGIAVDKINKEFDTRSTVLNKTSDTKIENIAAKVDSEKAVLRARITEKRNARGADIKAKRDLEVTDKIKDRKNKLASTEKDAEDLFGTYGSKKMIKKSKEKVLGKEGEKQINKKAPKTDAAKRIIAAKNKIAKLKAKKPKTTESKKLVKTNSKIGKQSSVKDNNKIIELNDQITKDTEIVRKEVIKSKKLVAKGVKKIKNAGRFTKKGLDNAIEKVRVGKDNLLFSLATKDGVSSTRAVRGIYATYKADREEGRQTEITTIKKSLEKNGYIIDEKYSDKDLRTAYTKLMENLDAEKIKSEKKQIGGKLIMRTNTGPVRKAQNGAPIISSIEVPLMAYYGPTTYNVIKNFLSYVVKNSTIGGIASSTGAGAYNLGSGQSTSSYIGDTPTIGLSKVIENPPVFGKKVDEIPVEPKAVTADEVPVETTDLTPEEKQTEFDNIDQALKDQAAADAAAAKSEAERLEIIKKYEEAAAALEKLDPGSPSWASQVGRLFEYIKPSDFIDGSRINVTRPVSEEVTAPVLQTLGVDNMPGYDYAESRGRLIPRTDTADSFASHVMAQKFHNQGIRNTNELSAKNAAFIENRRQSNLAIDNKNRASVAAAENENVRSTNRREEIFANQYNQALTARDIDRNKRRGQIINGISSYANDANKRLKEMDLTKRYNVLSNAQHIWATEYQPRFDIAVRDGKTEDVKKIKTEYMTNHKFDPDEINTQILNLRSQFKSLSY